jgi:hypothetical protein
MEKQATAQGSGTSKQRFSQNPPGVQPGNAGPERFCRACGKTLSPKHRFCMQCGAKAEPATPGPVLPLQTPSAASQPTVSLAETVPPPTVYQPTPPPSPAAPPTESRPSAVNAVPSTAADGKTMAFYDFDGAEPVVAWLVCVSGPYQGQSFNLKAGRNNIGRALNMDLALAQDPGISRNNHAAITFEPLKQEYYAQPGESSGLTYLNGELLMTFAPLHDYDKLRLGGSEFIFVSFCNERFTWDDYLK